MAKSIDWEKNLGRRLRLRDLHVFFRVVQCGSMAKAALDLGVSQPSISEVIAGLEHAVGVRLLERSSQGVETTVYGRALLRRGQSAFDELRQGIRDIEFLADPTSGEVRLGCAEIAAPGLLSPIIDRLSREYPKISIKVSPYTVGPPDGSGLPQGKLDLVISPLPRISLAEQYRIEVLLNDTIRVVVGEKSRWAARRKVHLSELADERWIMTAPETPMAMCVHAAFQAIGLEMPKIYLEAGSIHLRNQLLSTGRFVSAMATSVLRSNASQFGLKMLPIELPAADLPLNAITMKNRTLTPVVELFLQCARSVAKAMKKGSV